MMEHDPKINKLYAETPAKYEQWKEAHPEPMPVFEATEDMKKKARKKIVDFYYEETERREKEKAEEIFLKQMKAITDEYSADELWSMIFKPDDPQEGDPNCGMAYLYL